MERLGEGLEHGPGEFLVGEVWEVQRLAMRHICLHLPRRDIGEQWPSSDRPWLSVGVRAVELWDGAIE